MPARGEKLSPTPNGEGSPEAANDARPSAAVVIPTRARPAYLRVALDSVLPQARPADAEVLVVLDGPDPDSEAVARERGVRVVAHDEPLGLNAARNTALDQTTA